MTDSLSPLDLYRLNQQQLRLSRVLQDSFALVKDHVSYMELRLLKYAEHLTAMPESPRYDIRLHAYRDPTSFKYRWIIDCVVSSPRSPAPAPDKHNPPASHHRAFDDNPFGSANAAHTPPRSPAPINLPANPPESDIVHSACFRIVITGRHIGFDRSDTGERCFYRIGHQMPDGNTAISNDERDTAIRTIRAEFASWVALSCPDHAGLYFLDHMEITPTTEKLAADRKRAFSPLPSNNAPKSKSGLPRPKPY